MNALDQLRADLVASLHKRHDEIAAMSRQMASHWGYEDPFYRFYHQSFKVYFTQDATLAAVHLLESLVPHRSLNARFAQIIHDGTGHVFDSSHNRDWERHTRPILEAFAHAKYMIEMAERYGELVDVPSMLPSGFAALLYLFDIR